MSNNANRFAKYKDRGYTPEELREATFTPAELLALTEAELSELEAVDGDAPAEARWWRHWRQRRAKRDSAAGGAA